MFNGGGEIPAPVAQNVSSKNLQPYIRIVEQPASKALRFRYECEGRSAGSIPGASSTSENKTFPSIQVVGYTGRAIVVVSCVTKDAPHKPHPHNLVGREGCKKGVCTMEIPTDTMTVQFSNLGIQCVKKRDIEQALRAREEIRVDPFRTGFSHRTQPTTIDLNTVRLCFQVFIEGDTAGRFSRSLQPVVSEPIYDKKAMSDLSILKLSHCYSYVDGGRHDIILLCEKVAKEDIQVRFYEENGDWEAFADFQPSQVHKQHAIWFQTPRYRDLNVTEPVKVLIQLRRPSDGATSESLPFEFLPAPRRKRPKMDNSDQIFRDLQSHNRADNIPSGFPNIKLEPREPSPAGNLSPYSGVSPGYVPNIASPQYNISYTPPPSDHKYHVSPNYGPTSPAQDVIIPSTATLATNWNVLSDVTSTTTQQTWNIPSTSTNVRFNLDAGPTSPNPDVMIQSTSTLPTTWNVLPEVTPTTTQQTWNIPSTATNVLFNLDTGNSEEIDSLMQTGVQNFALPVLQISSDINSGLEAEMTDSLTKFANFTLDNM